MMLTVLKWFCLVLSGAILVVGLTPPMQRWLDQRHLIPNQYVHGDLYNITNLPEFREADYSAHANLTDADKPKQHYRDVHLYTIGDSFTDIDTGYYAGGRNVHRWVGDGGPVVAPLDTTKTNILVIEFIERVLQERMYHPDFERMYIRDGIAQVAPEPATQPTAATSETKASSWLFARFGSEINQRLEFLLFNSRFFVWFKELKAEIMLHVFGRVSGAVISHDHRAIFYQPEVDTNYVLSAFRPISDQKLDLLVKNMNTIRQHYLRMGFDEVYVAMIPNKVTVLEPTYGHYNHQIERIEANPHLEAPIISTIDTLRQHPEWYHLGDGHWNNQGKRFWLRHVNALARQWSKENK
ncbi:hypothetical protein [Spirosoma koreense]